MHIELELQEIVKEPLVEEAKDKGGLEEDSKQDIGLEEPTKRIIKQEKVTNEEIRLNEAKEEEEENLAQSSSRSPSVEQVAGFPVRVYASVKSVPNYTLAELSAVTCSNRLSGKTV